MDIIKTTNTCALFFRAIGIPVSCHNEAGECEVAYPLVPERLPVADWPQVQFSRNPDVYLSPSQGIYGIVQLAQGGFVTLGPSYNVPITETLVSAFMRESYIPHEQREQAEILLNGTTKTSLLTFMDKLAFLHYLLNDEIIDPMEHFSATDASLMSEMQQANAEQMVEAKESQEFHNTFQWEQQFYRLIQNGNPEKLTSFLELSNTTHLTSGTMADTPLRQAKNIFIGSITKVGVMGAIPGGLDVELTYQLIDSYVQECERATNLAEIDRLQYTMVMDFCRRVAAHRLPKGISREISGCISFIREHTNEGISVNDVVAHTGRSVSYILSRFKQEVGMNMGAYITQCKLEEAQELLAYTQKSLSEISNYLCFSSQSYFQNVFKKNHGVTPMQYRRQHQV